MSDVEAALERLREAANHGPWRRYRGDLTVDDCALIEAHIATLEAEVTRLRGANRRLASVAHEVIEDDDAILTREQALEAEVSRLSLQLMTHQVSGDYEAGYEMGVGAGAKHSEAENARLVALLREHEFCNGECQPSAAASAFTKTGAP